MFSSNGICIDKIRLQGERRTLKLFLRSLLYKRVLLIVSSVKRKTIKPVRKIVRYNLLIVILQFVVFALLLFAVFFIKFNMGQKAKSNSNQGFVIERNEY